jgi:murein DD-endopeptidase MepM/ murein hydrolase activator NlpD
MIKKIFIKMRTSIRLAILVSISVFLLIGAFIFLFKPIYKVTINGEFIGYCENKSDLQKRINSYMDTGDGSSSNIAFAEIDPMPKYEICLLKKGIVTNDEEIYEKVISNSTNYYRYFTIIEDEEEKVYVSDFSTAESIVNTLKEKKSTNIDNISIVEIYDTELKDFSTADDAVASLYVEPAPVIVVATTTNSSINTSRNMSYQTVDLGVTLARPVSGTISSRFGSISSVRSGAHTGLDIAAPKGTTITAAAAGTVIYAGTKGSYGKLIVIAHSSTVQTYYAHCNSISVNVGDYVTQGQAIGTVGMTGNATGYHLHLEIRVNGVAYNPINYVYN